MYCVNLLILLQVPSFSISDTIPGSTTSYHVLSSGSSVQSWSACMEDTCEYIFDLPPLVCSGSSVDIAIAAANKLGLGPPSETNIIGMCLTGQRLLCFNCFKNFCLDVQCTCMYLSSEPIHTCRLLVYMYLLMYMKLL